MDELGEIERVGRSVGRLTARARLSPTITVDRAHAGTVLSLRHSFKH